MENRKSQVESWYIKNSENIKKRANKRSLQDAEDILQDTAIRLLTSPAKWEAISQRKVTRWVMFDYYENYVETVEIEDKASPETMTEALFNKRSIELVTELVSSIQGKSRDIFLMRYFQDMGYEEIAEKLGMPHKSVKQLGSRAKSIIIEKFNNIMR